MAHLVEVGTQSFEINCPGGPRLVCRATSTLLREDGSRASKASGDKFDFRNAWITSKQEVVADIFIEADSEPTISKLDFVNQAIETVTASFIDDNPSLRASAVQHDYRSLTESVALHISVVLCKVPDISPPFLPRRLPRRVRVLAAEPHPPLGIDSAALSHIAIYIKAFRNIRSAYPGAKCVQDSDCLPKHETIELIVKHPDLNNVIYCSLQYLKNGDSRQYGNQVSKPTSGGGPSLLDIAPVVFKPGHYENIRQRAGLIPVVARSMARIFRSCQSSSSEEMMASVRSSLRARYQNCPDANMGESGHIPRSLIRCVVWMALQRGTYKGEWPKRFIDENSDTILLSDIDWLTNDSDIHEEYDRQMLSSGTSSDNGSDDILSHCLDDIGPDSGYSSLSPPEKLLPNFLGLDSFYGEMYHDLEDQNSAIEDAESELIPQPDTEKDIIRSSVPPRALSDTSADSSPTTPFLLSSEAFDKDDLEICGSQYDEDMMGSSSSMSIISSSTYQHIPEDLKQQDIKWENIETEPDSDSLPYTGETISYI